MRVDLIPDKAMNRKVSHLPGVKAAVKAEAEAITRTASGNLAAHRKTGRHHIELHRADSYRATDFFVSLVGPGALALEEGHDQSGKYRRALGHVSGLHILAHAIAAHRLG